MWEITCEEIYRDMYIEEELKKEHIEEQKKNMEYIIVGAIDGKEYLVYTCFTKENAEKSLSRILNNPNNNDKRLINKGYTDFRIDAVEKKNCWWD